MIAAVLILAAQAMTAPYDGILKTPGTEKIEGKPTTYHVYAEEDAGAGRRVVVYGFEADDHTLDFPHRVFIALLTGRGKSLRVTDRIDVTGYVRSTGEEGRFAVFNCRINPFMVGREQFADILLGSTLSGTGAITSVNDVFVRFGSDNKIAVAGGLEQSQAFGRSGWNFVRQTTSEIGILGDAIVWMKSVRVANGTNSRLPLQVRCGTSRIVYRLKDGRWQVSPAPLKTGKPRPLPRLDLKEIVPCCNRCTIPS
jgi:hypothetical protein